MGVWYRGGVVPWYHTLSSSIISDDRCGTMVPHLWEDWIWGWKAFKLSKYAKYHLCTYFHFKNHMLSGPSSHHFFWNISSLSNTSNLLARGLYLNVNYPYDYPQTFPELVFDYELWIWCLDTEKWPKTNNNLLTQNKNYHPLEGIQRNL